MKKRILIFSPYIVDQEGIESIIVPYLEKKFGKNYYLKDIEIQKFGDINESIKRKNKIGVGGEVFVIFDQKLCPEWRRKEPAKQTTEDKVYYEGLKLLLKMSQEICDKKGIPYILYQGEIEKREENNLLKKIKAIEEQILSKLEEKVVQ